MELLTIIDFSFGSSHGRNAIQKLQHAVIGLTTSLQSDIIIPNVTDITGPISGDTNIAATIFGALFSINPSAANELKKLW